MLKRVAEDTPRPIPEIIPEVPEWMCEIVSRLHAKDPDDRFASAREVADLLQRCLDDVNAGRVPENVTSIRVADGPGEPEAPISRPVDAEPVSPRPA